MRFFSVIVLMLLAATVKGAGRLRNIECHRMVLQGCCRIEAILNPKASLTRDQFCSRFNASLMLPGGYYWPLHRLQQPIDFVFSNEHTICPYRRDLHRPILASNRYTGNVIIFTKYHDFLTLKDQFTDAIAGDGIGQRCHDQCLRTLVSLKDNEIHFFIMLGTIKQCQARMKKLQMDQFLFLDSGTSCNPNTRMPVYLGVFPQP